MAWSGFKRAFDCLKTAFVSRFQVSNVPAGQLLRAQAATLLIVNHLTQLPCQVRRADKVTVWQASRSHQP